MKKEPDPIDASSMYACQLTASADYLSEADFVQPDGSYREVSVKIDKVTIELVQLPGRAEKDERKVIAFAAPSSGQKLHKRLVANKTNLRRIRDQLGRKVADWQGKVITLTYDPSVRLGRERVGGVRVKELGR